MYEVFVKLPPRTSRQKVLAAVQVVQSAIIEGECQCARDLKKGCEEPRCSCGGESAGILNKPADCSGIRFSIRHEPSIRYSITAAPKVGQLPTSHFADDASRLRSAVASIDAMKSADSGGFAHSLAELVRCRCNGRAPIAYKRAGLTRQAYSRIMSNRCSNVEKLTVLRLCIGLQLNRNEAESLLASAGYSLSESIPIDRIFIYCIEQGIWNILDVCSIVTECGLKSFDIAF